MCYFFFSRKYTIYYLLLFIYCVCVCVNVLLHNLFHDIIFLKFVFFSIWHIYIISVNRKINNKILIQLTCNQNNQHCNKFILLRPDIRVYTVVWTSLNKLINLLLIHICTCISIQYSNFCVFTANVDHSRRLCFYSTEL